jgi:hypothetical protein
VSAADPIFVRGLSRSGGTLLVTLLDAHPDVAMSYELYPTLLEPESPGGVRFVQEIACVLRGSWLRQRARARLPTRGVRTFVARCERSGLGLREVARLLEAHLDAGDSFDSTAGRLRFIERCAVRKMTREGKIRWGLKCNNRYDQYRSLWPSAYFLDVLRDGRDVLASQLTTGAFDSSPEEVAQSWVQTHQRFLALRDEPGVRAHLVRYEDLVTDPEPEIERLCAFLDLPPHPQMLDFHRRRLTIYRASHLSMDRISRPIDARRVGRWRKELAPEQVADFEAVAGDLLRRMNYPA